MPARSYQETMAFLAKAYGGYTNPWRARLDPGNGEDAYTALLEAHLRPDAVVVEAGCGHGAEALTLAPKVARLIAFDFAPEMIAIGKAANPPANLDFVVADCSPSRGGRIPAEDASVDLIVSRRGPTSFIADARRVLRPGGAMIQVAYMATPVPDWNAALPEGLRRLEEPEIVPARILDQLAAAQFPLHSAWTFDAAEIFDAPEELYRRLVWERREEAPPAYETVREPFERLFAQRGPLTLRQRRYVWKAVV